jgi:predicted metal-binding protein
VQLVPVECLSVCKRPCTVSFAASGNRTYGYGDLLPETSVETILAGAALYAAAPDGVIAWKLRPEALKRGVVARIPPLPPPTSITERVA